MQKFNKLIKYLITCLQSWYGALFVGLLFVTWVMFFDQYSVVKRWRIASENRQITSENQRCRERIADYELKIQSMSDNREALEKYARERYQMQADDEVMILFDE